VLNNSHPNEQPSPLVAERRFFDALIQGDTQALNRLLADDFILIDVLNGSEITRSTLLAVLESGQLKFEAIEAAEARVRFYPGVAVVNGRTKMSCRYQEASITVASRYTHVYTWQQEQWRLVAAQGTQIAGE